MLRELYLINAPGFKKRFAKFCSSLASYKNIKLSVLDLRDNDLDEYMPIQRLLMENQSIKTLNLFGNYIDEKSIQTIWWGLYNNTSLTKLTYAPSEDVILEQSTLD
jgi:hypothetical protein